MDVYARFEADDVETSGRSWECSVQYGLYFQTQVSVYKQTVLNKYWELCAPIEMVARVEQGPGGKCAFAFDTATYASFGHDSDRATRDT